MTDIDALFANLRRRGWAGSDPNMLLQEQLMSSGNAQPSPWVDIVFAMQCGDGSDGDVTLPAGPSVMTRNAYYNTLVVPVGATLDTNGWVPFARVSIECNGTISVDGRAGNPGVDGAYWGGAALTAVANSGPLRQQSAWGAGGVGARVGIAFAGSGTNASAGTLYAGELLAGGAGGNGDAGGGLGAGRAGGTAATSAVSGPQLRSIDALTRAGYAASDGTFRLWQSHSGKAAGGGGAGAGMASDGPAGGAPGECGGILYVPTPSFSGTGTLQSKGGAGGRGGNAGEGNAGGGGGGSGGPGGIVAVASTYRLGWSGTIDVTGGAAGAGGTKNGTGTNGAAGGVGHDGVSFFIDVKYT
jgi:hypothetical protein